MTEESPPNPSWTRIDFTIRRVHNGAGETAAACFRAAILYPLYPPIPRQYENTEYIAQKTLELIDRRRRRFRELRASGLAMLANNYGWYENCPPFGVYTNRQTRSCRLEYLCPFCWTRGFVAPVLQQVLLQYPESEQAVGIKNPDVLRQEVDEDGPRLLLYSSHQDYPADIDLRERMKQETCCVRLGQQQITANKKHHLGSVMWSSAELSDGGRSWRITRRRLTLVADKGKEPQLAVCDTAFPEAVPERVYCVQTGDIIRSVAKILQYPLWLMTGDVSKVVQWLDARRGLRLFSKCGKLRQSR